MSASIPVTYHGAFCYEICLEQDFKRLIEKLASIGCKRDQKVCIVADSNLEKLHLSALSDVVSAYFDVVISFCFPAGEASKTIDTVQRLYAKLIENQFDRHDLLLAFGGGVTGDLTGFAAATYLRGIDFVQIPTSLLSQVDSSIGGKTGVDFRQYKNMVGAFYQPRLVYMNLSLLHTLPANQFACGMGEIIKHACIKSADYFNWLKTHADDIRNRNPQILEEMIVKSCEIKRDVVERDPKEQGERALLNFGHTIGHAVEKLSAFQLLHGQCVGIGMAAACFLSCQFGRLAKEDCDAVLSLLRQFDLPVFADGLSDEDILLASRSDKKRIAGKIQFIVLDAIGHARIEPDLKDEQILTGIAFVSSCHTTKQENQIGEEP